MPHHDLGAPNEHPGMTNYNSTRLQTCGKIPRDLSRNFWPRILPSNRQLIGVVRDLLACYRLRPSIVKTFDL